MAGLGQQIPVCGAQVPGLKNCYVDFRATAGAQELWDSARVAGFIFV